MGAGELLAGLGVGVAAELLVYVLLTRLFGLQGKAAAMIVAMLVLLFYVPWAIIRWPGADIFAMNLAIFLTLAYGLGMVGSRVGKGWHWGPAIIVTFFIGVIVINVVFLTVAERGITGLFAELLPRPEGGEVIDSAFPGTVSHDFQEKEALYNAYLREVREQQARGWRTRYGWVGKPHQGEPAQLVLLVTDRDGAALRGARVRGSFLRTSSQQDDFDFEMSEVGEGKYSATLRMPLAGLWRMVLRVHRGEDQHEIRATTSVLASSSRPSP
jgi:nitrogen fixation protein FixH